MRNILTIALLLGGLHLTMAQDIERSVLGTAGESVSNSSGQLDITIGQVASLTSASTTSAHFTQGFNQPIVATNVSISEVDLLGLQIVAYPNPATDIVNVRTLKPLTSLTSYRILNQLGQEVSSGKLNPLLSSIDISNIASATYVLMITSEQSNLNKSIRFTKN